MVKLICIRAFGQRRHQARGTDKQIILSLKQLGLVYVLTSEFRLFNCFGKL